AALVRGWMYGAGGGPVADTAGAATNSTLGWTPGSMKAKWSIAGGRGLPTSPGSLATRHCAEPLRMSQYLWEICGNVPENGPKIEYIIVTLECTVLAIHLVEIGDCERTAFRSAPASAVSP